MKVIFTTLLLFSFEMCSAQFQLNLDSILLSLTSESSDSIKDISLDRLFNADIESHTQAFTYFSKAYEICIKSDYNDGIISSANELGNLLLKDGELDSAHTYYSIALSRAKQVENTNEIINGYKRVGDALKELGKTEDAMGQYRKSMDLAEMIEDTFSISDINNRIGRIYLDINEFDSALYYFRKALRNVPKVGDLLPAILGNIGLSHYYFENLDKASDYFTQSMVSAEEMGSKNTLAYSYQRMGLIEKKKKNYTEAITYYQKALKLLKSLNDRKNVSALVQNIGNIYFEKGDYDKAIEKYKESLKEASEVGDRSSESYALSALGSAFYMKKNFEQSIKYFLMAKELSDEIGSLLISMDARWALSKLGTLKNDYKKAYEYMFEYHIFYDSIYSQNKTQLITEMEAKYEASKKEKEIEILHAKNEINTLELDKRNAQRNILVVAALALCVITFALFRFYGLKKKAHNSLLQLDEMKSRFFTNISHEFRTPLTLILGPVQNRLSKDVPLEYREELLVIKKNGNRLLELVNQLLDLSKLEAGHMRLKTQKGDFYQVLKLSVSSFESLAMHKEIDLTLRLPNDSLNILYDQDKCEKIIYNLLSNALKYTPEGGTVEVEAKERKETLSVTIKDSGFGIPLEEQDNIFKRFHQLDNMGKEQGTGVGLALVKELVNLHYGNISFESKEGEGSTFIFELPITSKSYSKDEIINLNEALDRGSDPNNVSNDFNDEVISSSSLNELSVLLVEDNKDVREYISNILSPNYNLKIAENGKEGLKLAFEHIPDIIVSDLMMQKLDGMAFCEVVKSDEKTSHIPFIMLTAKADLESKLEGLETGVDDYLVKPFNEQELKTRIKNLLEQRERLRKRFERHVTLEPKQVAITPPDELFLTRAMKVLDENMSNCEFTVDMFQREMAMSRMQLHRKLKALVECSASEFIRLQRLKRASRILETKGISISEAAFQTGFNSLSYFSKCFKQEYNISPTDFIEQQKWCTQV